MAVLLIVLGGNFGLLVLVGDLAVPVVDLGLGVIEEACGLMEDHRTGHGRRHLFVLEFAFVFLNVVVDRCDL